MLQIPEILTVLLLFSSFVFSASVGILIVHYMYRRIDLEKYKLIVWIAVLTISSISTAFFSAWSPLLAVPILILILLYTLTQPLIKNMTVSGQLFLLSNVMLLLSGLPWSIWFIISIPISQMTRVLMTISAPLIIITLPSSMVTFIEQFEVLCRKHWFRPRLPLTHHGNQPFVSLHVPVHAEPPEIVKETLRRIAKIDYPHFEVIVIDNNTSDPSLWQPIKSYCEELGNRFHFYHVEGLTGAKAGALNFALGKTDEKAEIVGIIDSDYHTESGFLKKLVGYFDDPKIGFVQTPHDYRNWQKSLYLTMCYFEYKIFFYTTLVSMNERDATLTVGTMCLIRKKALIEAGKWAEWCVTEDSELSIRIHAIGYSSVYVTETQGRGLIPATFAGYKKQRYRWTAGPVQEFKKHFDLLIVAPWRKKSELSFFQLVHHFNHGLDRINVGVGLLVSPLALLVIASMVYHREIINVPFVLWLTATVLLVSSGILQYMAYHFLLGASFSQTIGALIASKALSHTISIASLKTMLSSYTPWERTNKFAEKSHLLSALSSTWVELSLGVLFMSIAVGAYFLLPFPGLLLMFLIGLGYKSFDYLCAPFMALLAERNN